MECQAKPLPAAAGGLDAACRVMLAAAIVAAAMAAGAGAVFAAETTPKTPDIQFADDEDESPQAGGANPFGKGQVGVSRKDAVPGYMELSTGLKVPGHIYSTRAKRLKVYNIARQMYEFVPVAALKRMEAVVEWERLDREWRFKEAGNPEKVYTDRTYPVRMLAWKLVLRNDHEIVGHILGQPLYVEHNGKADRFLLSKREKGPMGGSLEDLKYIRRVQFGPEAYNHAVDELKARAGAAAPKTGQAPKPD